MKIDKSVQIALILSATILIIAVLAYIGFARLNNPSNQITVNGISEVNVLPDIVAVYLDVQTNGTTATEAKDKNSAIVDSVISSMINLGLNKTDISTQNYNIYPEYDYSSGTSVQTGYLADYQIRVELNSDKTDIAGKVIDAGVNAGATISYINFELSKGLENQYKAQALTAATQDAKTKADAIAAGLNKKVGEIVSVSTSDFSYRPWPLIEASASGATPMAAKEAVTNIQPGQQTVSGQVTVTYKLE